MNSGPLYSGPFLRLYGVRTKKFKKVEFFSKKVLTNGARRGILTKLSQGKQSGGRSESKTDNVATRVIDLKSLTQLLSRQYGPNGPGTLKIR